MTEFYWLQRLGVLGEAFELICLMCAILAFMAILLSPVIIDTYDGLEKVGRHTVKKIFYMYCFVLCFSAAGSFFIPTQKEMLMIYGVGGTIDYIKSNDKAKELPDKCIDALTRYVDSIEKENKDNNNN